MVLSPEAELPALVAGDPANTKNGDIASNIAMAGARHLAQGSQDDRRCPCWLICLPSSTVCLPRWRSQAPAFINLFLAPPSWASVVLGACSNKEYGRTDHEQGKHAMWIRFPPTPPAPCTWATPAAVLWATVWPLCWTGPGL